MKEIRRQRERQIHIDAIDKNLKRLVKNYPKN